MSRPFPGILRQQVLLGPQLPVLADIPPPVPDIARGRLRPGVDLVLPLGAGPVDVGKREADPCLVEVRRVRRRRGFDYHVIDDVGSARSSSHAIAPARGCNRSGGMHPPVPLVWIERRPRVPGMHLQLLPGVLQRHALLRPLPEEHDVDLPGARRIERRHALNPAVEPRVPAGARLILVRLSKSNHPRPPQRLSTYSSQEQTLGRRCTCQDKARNQPRSWGCSSRRKASPPSCGRPCAAAFRRGRRPSSRRSRNASSGSARRRSRTAGRGGCRCGRSPARRISGRAAASRLASFQASARSTCMRVGLRWARMSAISTARPSSERLASWFMAETTSSSGRQALDRLAPCRCCTARTRRSAGSRSPSPPWARWDRRP